MMPNVVLSTCMRQRGVTRFQSGAQLEEGRSTTKQFEDGAVENLGIEEPRPRICQSDGSASTHG